MFQVSFEKDKQSIDTFIVDNKYQKKLERAYHTLMTQSKFEFFKYHIW